MSSQATKKSQFTYLAPPPQITFSEDGTVIFMAGLSFETDGTIKHFNQATQDRLSREFHEVLAYQSLEEVEKSRQLGFATDEIRKAMDVRVRLALNKYNEGELTSNDEVYKVHSKLPTNPALRENRHKMSWMRSGTLKDEWADEWDYRFQVIHMEHTWKPEEGNTVMCRIIPLTRRKNATGSVFHITSEGLSTLLDEVVDENAKDLRTIAKNLRGSLEAWPYRRRCLGGLLTSTTENEGRDSFIKPVSAQTSISTPGGSYKIELWCYPRETSA